MPTDALSILLASTSASLALDLLIHPLDTIKTRVQSREYTQFLERNRGAGIWKYPGISRGLYQGIGTIVAASFPAAAAFFLTYEYTQSGLQVVRQKFGSDESSSIHVLSDFCAASAADLAACVVYAPAVALKNNAQMIQSEQPNISGPMTGRKLKVVAQSATSLAFKKFASPRQLWSGYPALVAHSLPVSVIQMPLYEAFRHYITEYRLEDEKSSYLEPEPKSRERKQRQITIKEVSVTAATRIMLDAAHTNAAQQQQMIKLVQEILRADGLRGLFRGCTINSVMMGLGSGLYFGLYESAKCWLRKGSPGAHLTVS
ncbi:mitochondrial carrier domain-containing protein [Aspergillus avenaceus]|uniref:Mitochondrial carrier domain-containing protein n=1 Tax=Aspergillus avenaceus TaxID=36643 RepID=A0A5N6TT34_ASPAV|nr:mitochondrial carrier domain-containing protein [Aspergillus avenaceus]